MKNEDIFQTDTCNSGDDISTGECMSRNNFKRILPWILFSGSANKDGKAFSIEPTVVPIGKVKVEYSLCSILHRLIKYSLYCIGYILLYNKI